MRLIYAGTDTEWGDCILDHGCNTDAITPGLQATWAKASRAIEKAEQFLDSLDPHSDAYDSSTASDT